MADLNVSRYLDQFRNLNMRDVGTWPIAPRIAAVVAIVVVVILAGWYFYWSDQLAELQKGVTDEVQLKTQYKGHIPRLGPLAGDERATEPPSGSDPLPARSTARPEPAPAPALAAPDALAEQSAELARLRNEVAALRDLVTGLQDRVRELAARLG